MDVVNRSQSLSSISFITGTMAGRTFPINKPVITIGRDAKHDIVLSDQSVSRDHARLVNTNGQWSIEKLSPTNTITVNKRDVQSSPIHDRDEISLGGVTSFLFHVAPASDMPGAAAVQPPSFSQPQPVVPQQSFAQAPFPPSQVPQQSFAQVPFPPPSQVPQQPFAQSYAEPAPSQPLPYGSSPSYQSMGMQAAGVGVPPSLNTPYYTEPMPPGAAPSGAASIEVSSNIHSNKLAMPLAKDVINIGRDPSNDVVITEQVVSGFHAQIVREGNQYVFIHPHPQARQGHTLNGVIYQGRHIKGDETFRKPLARGDFFRIGDEHGTLVTISYNDGSGDRKSTRLNSSHVRISYE